MVGGRKRRNRKTRGETPLKAPKTHFKDRQGYKEGDLKKRVLKKGQGRTKREIDLLIIIFEEENSSTREKQ